MYVTGWVELAEARMCRGGVTVDPDTGKFTVTPATDMIPAARTTAIPRIPVQSSGTERKPNLCVMSYLSEISCDICVLPSSIRERFDLLAIGVLLVVTNWLGTVDF